MGTNDSNEDEQRMALSVKMKGVKRITEARTTTEPDDTREGRTMEAETMR